MKKIIVLLLTVLAILSCAACGSQPANGDDTSPADTVVAGTQPQNAAEWLDLLTAELPFEDNMQAIPDGAPSLYGIFDADGYTGDSVLYVSSAATPEEIAVFEVDPAFSAAQLTELAEARIANQKDMYSSYAPEQVPKLDSAVIRSCGNFVIVCICADNAKAASLLAAYA